MRRLSRRTFLQAATAATVAARLRPCPAQINAPIEQPYPENGTLIPDDGWLLWIDENAAWKDDAIFLPEDVQLDKLPTNAPSGGWSTLDEINGKPVLLPTTVEQHFWGKFGSRAYTPDEYRYAADDPVPQNGAYLGVSWWYRPIDIPAEWKGLRIFLHIRGARLRAEVYLNQKLVGYSIMEELPFECDLTEAANPGGENQLAIRITNPFGRYDWVDGLNAQWGAVKLYRSHGFGGLDRGMTISAHPIDMQITHVRLLNTPDPRTISLDVSVTSGRGFKPGNIKGLVYTLSVTDAYTGNELTEVNVSDVFYEVMGRSQRHSAKLTFPSAKLWDLETPNLYNLRVTFETDDGQTDTRDILFGFRWFAPDGIGTNAIFRLNGRRIKLYSSISWGFWGLNGLFPTPELAEKEVMQAKKLNLNCLNFHRNLAKEEVLRAHDRLGLLRYMEPGGGKMAIGKLPTGVAANANSIVMEKPSTEDDKFAQRFMFVKCVQMVKVYCSHPSVIIYCLQNELGADLKNPDTLAILAAMRTEDPSRCIVLNDGFVAPPRRAAQAWFEPWNPKLHRSDEVEWGDWWNQHQGAGDQWYDEFYKSPTDFTYQSPWKKVLTEFGEMEGCATPDNHSLMIHQIRETYKEFGGTSYDLTDHEEIIAAYDKFLDKWKFRSDFPSVERLWLSLGKKCYDTWQNYLENARISDDLDFAVISGWESTTIENHSGIVDNLRNFKSDPAPISGALTAIRPVAKQRSASIAAGDSATFDLYLLNDTAQAATGTLEFTAITPSDDLLKLGTFPAPAAVKDQFSYLVKEAFQTPPLTEEGLYRFKFSLSSAPLSTQTKEIWVTETQGSDAVARKRDIVKGVRRREIVTPMNVGGSGVTPALIKQLRSIPQVNVEGFTPGKKYDVIVCSGLTANTSAEQNAGDTTGLEAQPGARPSNAPGIGKPEPGEVTAPVTQFGRIDPVILEAIRTGTPLLAIPQADTLSEGVAKQLAAAGAFLYNGTVGDFRAPWMGNWYFVREHPIYAGMPTNQVMGIHYQAKGRQSNGLLVDGPNVEIIAAYGRDHDRNIGAGTFTTRLGKTRILYHRVPELHPVLQQRFLANALAWLTS